MLGTNYKETPLSVLEKIYFNTDKIKQFIRELPSDSPLKEIVILSTCNRVEIYFSAQDPTVAGQWLKTKLETFFQLSFSLKNHLKYQRCEEAVTHLFKVAAGIESMVFGENEVLTQIKKSYDLSKELNATGSFLNKLFQSAIAVGKKVRDETKIGRGAYSVSSIAVDCIVEQDPNFRAQKIVIIGAGQMAKRALQKLKALKHPHLYVMNRTKFAAEKLAKTFEATFFPFERLGDAAEKFDLFILAVDTPTYLFTLDQFRENKGNRKFIVDLGMPRIADPQIGKLPGVTLMTIEELRDIADRNVHVKKQELGSIETIIQTEVTEFTKWYHYKKGLKPSA